MVGGMGVGRVAEALCLRNIRLRRFDDDIMVEGYLQESVLFSVGRVGQAKGKSNDLLQSTRHKEKGKGVKIQEQESSGQRA